MAHFFITGANRGIGLDLAKKALSQGHKVYCAARHLDGARCLWELESDFKGQCLLLPLDVTSDVFELKGHLPSDEPIDVLINNAGVFPEYSEGLEQLDLAKVRQAFEVNTFGPLKVTRALLPYLRASSRPTIAHISSKMGSLADNTSGLAYGYRMSKAALNMLALNMAHEYKDMITVALHPGWVKTDMGGPGALTDTWESAEGLFHVIMGLRPKDSGTFLSFQGEPVPY